MVTSYNLIDKVRFLGPLYDFNKLAAYVDADVFILPSKDKQESFGNVILEASACGTPSVVTKVCGVSEWMENVITVDPYAESIKIGIQQGLENTKLGKKAAIEVNKKFSWDTIVDKYILVYSEMLNDEIKIQ